MGLEKKIEEAIRTTLVIENKDSVKYAIDKILKIIDNESRNKREWTTNSECRK